MDIHNSVMEIRDLIQIVLDKSKIDVHNLKKTQKNGYLWLNWGYPNNFHLSVGDMNAWEAKGKWMITYAI